MSSLVFENEHERTERDVDQKRKWANQRGDSNSIYRLYSRYWWRLSSQNDCDNRTVQEIPTQMLTDGPLAEASVAGKILSLREGKKNGCQ